MCHAMARNQLERLARVELAQDHHGAASLDRAHDIAQRRRVVERCRGKIDGTGVKTEGFLPVDDFGLGIVAPFGWHQRAPHALGKPGGP